MKAQCQIKWIDRVGNPTPDTNPAVGYVYLDERTITPEERARFGYATSYTTRQRSADFPICAEHVKQITGQLLLEGWHFVAYSKEEN